MDGVMSESYIDLRIRKTLSMRRHSMFENRETSDVPVARCAAGRSEKTCGRNSDMYGF